VTNIVDAVTETLKIMLYKPLIEIKLTINNNAIYIVANHQFHLLMHIKIENKMQSLM